ncbi:MAG: hypothetical protein ACRDLT_16530 [Solirubrobacteraceae bacterium]
MQAAALKAEEVLAERSSIRLSPELGKGSPDPMPAVLLPVIATLA